MSKTLAEMIAVMQAAERGETIETQQVDGNWVTNPSPSWNWGVYTYRVKPQPKVIYVNEYSDTVVAYSKEKDAVMGAGSPVRKAVKYVEAQD